MGSSTFSCCYMVCAFGAALLHMLINYMRIQGIEASFQMNKLKSLSNGLKILNSGRNFIGPSGDLNLMLNIPMLGASGAVFGLLAAFGTIS